MYKEALRPAWVEIDLKKFNHNVKEIIRTVGAASGSVGATDRIGSCTSGMNDASAAREIIGVIKADAYGHGAIECAKALRENGVKTFAIATLQEAIELRDAGCTEEILMLGLTPNMYVDTLVEYDITPVVCDSENARSISDEASRVAKTVEGFIAVDTGMGRIGYLSIDDASISDAVNDIKKIAALPNFKIKGIFSHMATADAFDKEFAHVQEERFNNFYNALTEAGFEVPIRTLANSASITELPELGFDAVRPGITMYGCYPSHEVDRSLIDLQQVMSVKAAIVHLKDVPVGFSCGYGRKFIAERPSKIATLTLGYADGLPRPYSAHAKVIVNGVLCPIAGNICMDQCMVDVTDVPDVKLGDEVIVMGSDGTHTISAEDIGDATGTIDYEICCAFGQRLPKIYIR
ncbi:MAG: alanine racemase [Firmicutes bacterium]|nr:alanine racemase [Bacillota bacterium]